MPLTQEEASAIDAMSSDHRDGDLLRVQLQADTPGTQEVYSHLRERFPRSAIAVAGPARQTTPMRPYVKL